MYYIVAGYLKGTFQNNPPTRERAMAVFAGIQDNSRMPRSASSLARLSRVPLNLRETDWAASGEILEVACLF